MAKDLSSVWLEALSATILRGKRVLPRGMETKELMSKTYIIDMRRPVVTVPERKLSYRFMAAESYWILSGDDKVAGIAPYNENITKFSDDGVNFFGAYGPKIMDQLEYVCDKLVEDPESRQAGLTIWREKPPKTKDVPCTVAMFFNVREGKLNSNVFMRSNDVWLGLPYDAFNFSMVAHKICGLLNSSVPWGIKTQVVPGDLYLTAASSHLYASNFEAAKSVIISNGWRTQPETPECLYQSPYELRTWLKQLRETKPGDPLRWWEHETK